MARGSVQPDTAQEPVSVDLPTSAATSALAGRPLALWELVLLRVWHGKLAVVGAIILLLMVAMAVFAPIITPENPYDVSTWDVTNQGLSPRLAPAWYFILGTDANGHLVLSQIAWGARVSLSIGLLGTLGSLMIGVLVGGVAGYAGDWIDTLLMRVTDVFLIMPFVPVILLAIGLFGGRDAWAISRVLVVFAWPPMARLTRVVYMSLRNQDFVLAARALGVSHRATILRHLLPNALGPIIATTAAITATCITVEAVADFFGLGLQYPNVSWGTILLAAYKNLNADQWWWPVFPGAALMLTVLAVSFVGRGIEAALDARASGL